MQSTGGRKEKPLLASSVASSTFTFLKLKSKMAAIRFSELSLAKYSTVVRSNLALRAVLTRSMPPLLQYMITRLSTLNQTGNTSPSSGPSGLTAYGQILTPSSHSSQCLGIGSSAYRLLYCSRHGQWTQSYLVP